MASDNDKNDRISYDPKVYKALESSIAPLIRQQQGERVDITPDSTKPQPLISPLRTFESDSAELINAQKKSVFEIQQAEVHRKEAAKTEEGKKEAQKKVVFKDPSRKNGLLMLGSALLFMMGIGALLYFFILNNSRETMFPPPQIQSLIPSQYETVVEDGNDTRGVLTKNIQNAILATEREVGSIEHIKVVRRGSLVDFEKIFTELSDTVPSTLLRALSSDTYMLGALARPNAKHPFIIVEVEDYENAFSQMLEHEKDLSRIFDFIQKTSSSTPLTSSIPEAGTTSTTTQITSAAPTLEIQQVFRDALVRNRDVRLIRDQYGNAKVLYSFYNKQTLVITTNEAVFSDLLNVLQTSDLAR